MLVKNMLSSRGNKVPNQFIINIGLNLTAFQSYNTLICVYDSKNDTLYLDKKKYSVTTSKYTNIFIEDFQPLSIIKVDNEQLYRIIERG